MNTSRTTNLNHTLRAHPARAGILFMLLCLLATQTRAATNYVTTTADTGPGSLRQTLTEAASGDTIAFSVSGTIALTNGQLMLDKSLDIVGPGAANLAINGNYASRVLFVDSGAIVRISRLTIQNGKAADGTNGTISPFPNPPTPGGPGEHGGAIHSSGTLTLQDCRITSSAAGRGGDGIKSGVSPSAGGAGGSGGGIYSSGLLTLSNCVVSGNTAGAGGLSASSTYSPVSGPGGFGGGICSLGPLKLIRTVVTSNAAGNGGDTPVELYGANGGAGGGIWCGGSCVAIDSRITGNSAGTGGHGGVDTLDGGPGGGGGSGGGLYADNSLVMTNCLVNGNRGGLGGDGGGGAYGHGGSGGDGGFGGGVYAVGSIVLNGCTVAGNSSGLGGHGGLGYTAFGNGFYAPAGIAGAVGGLCGTNGNSFYNCIIYHNTAPSDANYSANPYTPLAAFSCTTPSPGGVANITNAPLFVNLTGGNLRLQSNSPCINTGNNSYSHSATDLDGRPRIVDGTIDIGAYEYQGAGMGEYLGWFQQFGLPTDGSADYADTDVDGLNNWQEWRCQTCPTNALSALRLLTVTRTGSDVTVRWQSAVGVSYSLERCTNLSSPPAFSLLATNVPGQPGSRSFVDTNAASLSPLFYRVRVP